MSRSSARSKPLLGRRSSRCSPSSAPAGRRFLRRETRQRKIIPPDETLHRLMSLNADIERLVYRYNRRCRAVRGGCRPLEVGSRHLTGAPANLRSGLLYAPVDPMRGRRASEGAHAHMGRHFHDRRGSPALEQGAAQGGLAARRRGDRRANQGQACPAQFTQIFSFTPDPNQIHINGVPFLQEGRCATSRTRSGMRWTQVAL